MSGVSQVVYALIQMQGGFVAPHINLEQPEPAAARLNIPTKPTVTNIDHVLCNAFGFGGTNSSIIISKP
jgi:3-oxoacyl-[acyl-carrier-protein] synthase-1